MKLTQNHQTMQNSKAYLKLLESFPPIPITSENKALTAQKAIDNLLDQNDLTVAEQTYLDVLGILLSDYETSNVLIPDIYGVELLQSLINEHELRQKDLVPIFKTESIISAILNGHRKFTVEHIQKLSEYFMLSPSVFFPRNGQMEIEKTAQRSK